MLLHRLHRDELRHGDYPKSVVKPKLHAEVESACPICRSRKVLFSNFQGILERTVFRFLRIYPFWCNACDTRFYLFSKTSFSRQGSELP
jgi:hypothetical protein